MTVMYPKCAITASGRIVYVNIRYRLRCRSSERKRSRHAVTVHSAAQGGQVVALGRGGPQDGVEAGAGDKPAGRCADETAGGENVDHVEPGADFEAGAGECPVVNCLSAGG